MIFFESLSKEARSNACAALNVSAAEKQKIMYNGVKQTLTIISNCHGTGKAVQLAWKIAVGNYLINRPEEIAEYCMQAGA